MDEIFTLNKAMFKWWANVSQAQLDAWTTISLRMPNLILDTFRGKPPSAETVRMVREKVSAAVEGSIAGSHAAALLGADIMTTKMNAPKLALGLMDVADATMAPARQKVRANARRLSKRKS